MSNFELTDEDIDFAYNVRNAFASEPHLREACRKLLETIATDSGAEAFARLGCPDADFRIFVLGYLAGGVESGKAHLAPVSNERITNKLRQLLREVDSS